MAHNSTENLIDSDTSTDELNKGSHSRSVEKVSKKMFHKTRTAFVEATNSVASTSSSVPSSPQQHPIIVVGTADVHRQPPPKPFPRKHLMTTSSVDLLTTNRNEFTKVDDIVEESVSGESESNNSDAGEAYVAHKEEDIEMTELKSKSESSGPHSDRTEEPKMFFARSRKNTIVTNIDEVSTKSSSRTSKSSQNGSKSQQEKKPLPKPRQHIQSQYEIVDEKLLPKKRETISDRHSVTEFSHNQQSKSTSSESETLAESEISNDKKSKTTEEEHKRPIIRGTLKTKSDVIDKSIGGF